MGRTNPTYRDRLTRLERDWRDFRRPLRRRDQRAFDELLEAARNYADASGNLNPGSIEVTVLLSIAVAQQRRLSELEQQVQELADALEEPDSKS